MKNRTAVGELNDNSLKIKWKMSETQVDNHWSLSEIYMKIKWTLTECSENHGK